MKRLLLISAILLTMFSFGQNQTGKKIYSMAGGKLRLFEREYWIKSIFIRVNGCRVADYQFRGS